MSHPHWRDEAEAVLRGRRIYDYDAALGRIVVPFTGTELRLRGDRSSALVAVVSFSAIPKSERETIDEIEGLLAARGWRVL